MKNDNGHISLKDSTKKTSDEEKLEHESDPGHYSKTKCIDCWWNTDRAKGWRAGTCACWGSTAPTGSAGT